MICKKINVSSELDKYVIDNELQNTGDFIFCEVFFNFSVLPDKMS